EIALLPEDPDRSAAGLRSALRERLGGDVAVIVSDTLGRAWRTGQTDVAIGGAGMRALRDYRGEKDALGAPLQVPQSRQAGAVAGGGGAGLRGGGVGGRLLGDDRGGGGRRPGPRGGALWGGGAAGPGARGRGGGGRPRRSIRSFAADPVDPAAVRRALAAAV